MKTFFQILLLLGVLIGGYYYGGLSIIFIATLLVSTHIVNPYLIKLLFPNVKKKGEDHLKSDM